VFYINMVPFEDVPATRVRMGEVMLSGTSTVPKPNLPNAV